MDPSGPAPDQPLGSPSELDDIDDIDDVDGWVASLRVEQAALDRARAEWLVRQAEEEASLVGVLTDLAQQGRPVLIHLRSGRRHRGELRVVGTDFCALRTNVGNDVLVTYRDMASLRTQPGIDPVVGDRVVTPRASLREALAALGGQARRVLVVTAGDNESVGGELHSVGFDLVTIRLDGAGGWAYLPLASVAEVSLLESG